jgi:hypothetical protein
MSDQSQTTNQHGTHTYTTHTHTHTHTAGESLVSECRECCQEGGEGIKVGWLVGRLVGWWASERGARRLSRFGRSH